jgi:hypothetical protein
VAPPGRSPKSVERVGKCGSWLLVLSVLTPARKEAQTWQITLCITGAVG